MATQYRQQGRTLLYLPGRLPNRRLLDAEIDKRQQQHRRGANDKHPAPAELFKQQPVGDGRQQIARRGISPGTGRTSGRASGRGSSPSRAKRPRPRSRPSPRRTAPAAGKTASTTARRRKRSSKAEKNTMLSIRIGLRPNFSAALPKISAPTGRTARVSRIARVTSSRST